MIDAEIAGQRTTTTHRADLTVKSQNGNQGGGPIRVNASVAVRADQAKFLSITFHWLAGLIQHHEQSSTNAQDNGDALN